MSDPFGESAAAPETLKLLRRAGIERDRLGERLARHEYLALRDELQAGQVFDFRIELQPHPGQPDPIGIAAIPEIGFDAERLAGLPRLSVPLGRIAWVRRPGDLPVAGILIGTETGAALAASLLPLLAEHHRQPFARLVFLCRTLAPVHVLGRYDFACHHVGTAAVEDFGPVLAQRYGMEQIRTLAGGRKIWTRD